MFQEIKKLIGKGEIEKALEMLAGHSRSAKVQLSSFRRMLQEKLMGTISVEQEELKFNRAVAAALKIIDQLEAKNTKGDIGSNATPQSSNDEPPKTVKIFISYARKDRRYKTELEVHLRVLKREYKDKISHWSDVEINPSVEWDKKIKDELKQAQIILLLISPNFLASDYIWENELNKVLKRRNKDKIAVFPIFLDHCRWSKFDFAKLQGLPRDGSFIKNLKNRNRVYVEIMDALALLINDRLK